MCTAFYVIPQTAVLGAVLLTGYLGGAVATSVRVSGPLFNTLFPIIFAAFMWAGRATTTAQPGSLCAAAGIVVVELEPGAADRLRAAKLFTDAIAPSLRDGFGWGGGRWRSWELKVGPRTSCGGVGAWASAFPW